MSLHHQRPYQDGPTQWYAYCGCGVCSPPLRTRLLAVKAECAHREVCSQREATA